MLSKMNSVNPSEFSVCIWDMDNCLADDSWRAKYVDWGQTGEERYREYNSHCHNDPAYHQNLFAAMLRVARPAIFTGRSEEFREKTEIFLKRGYGVDPWQYDMYMRAIGERASPVELKQRMLANYKLCFPNVTFIAAYDDLPEVVDMYKVFGIHGQQLKIHDVDLYNPPADKVGLTDRVCVAGFQVGKGLMRALGLPQCTVSLEFSLHANKLMKCTAGYYPRLDSDLEYITFEVCPPKNSTLYKALTED